MWHQHFWGANAAAWLDTAPVVADSLLAQWSLTPDGPTTHGAVAWIIPVRRADGTEAVLKLQPVDDETVGEPLALGAWAGHGAVLLFEHDAESGSMLLERLDAARSLGFVANDLVALEALSELLAQLSAVPAPEGLRRLADVGTALLEQAERVLPRAEGVESLVRDCSAALRQVLPESGDRLLHWDLHYDNVLAPLLGVADRGSWLAIDPKPLSGDPCFELLPSLARPIAGRSSSIQWHRRLSPQHAQLTVSWFSALREVDGTPDLALVGVLGRRRPGPLGQVCAPQEAG